MNIEILEYRYRLQYRLISVRNGIIGSRFMGYFVDFVPYKFQTKSKLSQKYLKSTKLREIHASKISVSKYEIYRIVFQKPISPSTYRVTHLSGISVILHLRTCGSFSDVSLHTKSGILCSCVNDRFNTSRLVSELIL